MVDSYDFLEVGVVQLAVDAVDEGAYFPRVDEEGLFASITEAAFGGGVLEAEVRLDTAEAWWPGSVTLLAIDGYVAPLAPVAFH